MNVKYAEAPLRTQRHACHDWRTKDSGFPILCPILAMRAYKPTQLFGLMQNMDVTTMLFYGLTGPRGQRPIISRVPDDHIIDKHRTKIQGTIV